MDYFYDTKNPRVEIKFLEEDWHLKLFKIKYSNYFKIGHNLGTKNTWWENSKPRNTKR
jgi:hypothetical protein